MKTLEYYRRIFDTADKAFKIVNHAILHIIEGTEADTVDDRTAAIEILSAIRKGM